MYQFEPNQEALFYLQQSEPLTNPEYKLDVFDPTDLAYFLSLKGQQRKNEFYSSRRLFNMLYPGEKITRDENGAPVFPKGISGSISNKDGIIALALTHNESAKIGIDIEHESINPSLSSRIAPNEDIQKLSIASGLSESKVLALCFSAKESIYKAISPTLEGRIKFGDVTLEKVIKNKSASSGKLILSTSHQCSILKSLPKVCVQFARVTDYNTSLILTFTYF